MRNVLHVMKFARKYWRRMLLAFLALMATTAFSLTVPRLISSAIDNVITTGVRSHLIYMSLGIIGAAILRGIFSYLEHYLAQVASQKIAYDLRNVIYDRLQRLSFSYYDKAQTGDLMSRATADVEGVRMFFGMGLFGIMRFVVLTVSIFILLVLRNWQMTLISLGMMVVITFIAVNLSRHMRPIWLRIQQLIASLGTTLEENLTGVMVVKSFSRHKEEINKFDSEAGNLYEKHIEAVRYSSRIMAVMGFLMTAVTVIIIWFGGNQRIAGNLTPGQLTEFLFYLGIVAMPIRRLGFEANLFSRSASAGQRIYEVLNAKSAVTEKPDAIDLADVKGQVRFDNVSFGYDILSPVLKNASFVAKPGELVALVGVLGSGKTTIANLIPRFYDVTEGSVTIDGIDVRDLTLSSLRKNVGIVHQEPFLFQASIADNIAYGKAGATMEEIESAAKAAQLHNFITQLPRGYNTQIGERGVTLSGGEKQRLTIARTLLTSPPILIMDEATSSVDAETESLIREAVLNLVKGRTTFVITHRLTIIKNADQILLLDEGRIVDQGKHDDLMAHSSIYKKLYEMQLAATKGLWDDVLQ